MSYHVPFSRDRYIPKSIPGNQEATAPVAFELSMVGGPDRVRLKGILYAITGLSTLHEWVPDVQAQVIDGFKQAPQIFAHGIDAIHGFTVAMGLARKAGLIEALPEGCDLDTPFPVTTGAQFAQIAPFQIVLALEIAMQIARLSDEGQVDPRFFPQPTTSPVKRATSPGRARTARRRRNARETAGAAPAPDSSSTLSTSRPAPSK